MMELKEASEDDMDTILTRLIQHLPKSSMLVGALRARKKYKGIWDVSGTRLFYSVTSSLVIATPACSEKGRQSLTFFWDQEQEEDIAIGQLLSQIPNLDWHQPVFILAAPLLLMAKVQKLVDDGQLGDGVLKSYSMGKGHLYSLDAVPKDVPGLPDGFEMRTLSGKDARHTYDHWDYNFSESFDCYKQLMNILPGMGIFKTANQHCCTDEKESITKKGDEAESTTGTITRSETTVGADATVTDSDAVAWTHLSSFNLITNTFTLPEYRKRGLAKAVTLALAERSLKDTGVAFACVTQGHEASMRMHDKLGFTRQCTIGYQYYGLPTGDATDNQSSGSSRWTNKQQK